MLVDPQSRVGKHLWKVSRDPQKFQFCHLCVLKGHRGSPQGEGCERTYPTKQGMYISCQNFVFHKGILRRVKMVVINNNGSLI